jgi:two-component system, cell cycle sensor histidine kinase and response regulator CckA
MRPAKPSTRTFYRMLAGACGKVRGRIDLSSGSLHWIEGSFLALLGYAEGEVRFDFEDIPHLVNEPDVDLFREAWARLRNGNPVHFETRLVDQGGQARWMCITATTDKTPGQMLLAIEDVQERRAMVDAEVERRRTAGLETLAAGIAHEFNNLLTPVRGFVEMALGSLQDGHPAADGLRTALAQVDRCSDLVDMILHSGRKAVLHRRRADLPSVITTTLRLARSLTTPTRSVLFAGRVPADLPDAYIDQAAIRVALLHLLRNAISALPNGGEVTVSADVLRSPDEGPEAADFLWISVRDHGIGIRKEDLAYIFDPFFTTRNRSEARGLGLSMVQGVAEQHGGWVQVQSEQGKGTDIRMFLPIWRETNMPFSVTSGEAGDLLRNRAAGRVLVCEPRKAIRLLAGKVFDDQGWRVSETENLAEAEELLAANPERFDLVAIEAAECGTQPLTVIRALQQLLGQSRVLVLNATPRDRGWSSLGAEPGLAFAGAPFSPRTLWQEVHKLMSSGSGPASPIGTRP